MASSSRTNRRIAVADAAIALLAEAGSRGLTHRAVDRRLSIPEGSTSHYYPTRSGLVAAAMARMLETQVEEAATMDFTSASREDFGRALAALVRQPLDGPDWGRRAARHELMLEARREPGLRDGVTTLRDRIVEEAEAILRQVGCAEPELGARAITTFMSGVVVDCLVYDKKLISFDELVDHLDRLLNAY